MRFGPRFLVGSLLVTSTTLGLVQATSYSGALISSAATIHVSAGEDALITTPQLNQDDLHPNLSNLIRLRVDNQGQAQPIQFVISNHMNHSVYLSRIEVEPNGLSPNGWPALQRLSLSPKTPTTPEPLLRPGTNTVPVVPTLPAGFSISDLPSRLGENRQETAAMAHGQSSEQPVRLTFVFRWDGGLVRITGDYTIQMDLASPDSQANL